MIGRIISGFIVILVGTTLLFEFAKPCQLIGVTFEEKPHRQTYEEYVQERLRIERMMR